MEAETCQEILENKASNKSSAAASGFQDRLGRRTGRSDFKIRHKRRSWSSEAYYRFLTLPAHVVQTPNKQQNCNFMLTNRGN